MSMFQKIVSSLLLGILPCLAMNGKEVTNATEPKKFTKDLGFKKVEETWQVTVDHFSALAGPFSFQLIITAPTGKRYRTGVITSNGLPSQATILLKNPVKGTYLVFAKFLNVVNSGFVESIITITNGQNTVRYVKPAIITASTTALAGTRNLLTEFSIPY